MATSGELTNRLDGVPGAAQPPTASMIERAEQGSDTPLLRPTRTSLAQFRRSQMGRPSTYNEETVTELLAWIGAGKSLNSYCKEPGTPGLKTVYQWLLAHEDFAQSYAHAKSDSADTLADDIMDLADEAWRGTVDAQQARVAIDAKKWVAAKLKPKKYGDKLDLTTNGRDLPTPIMGITPTSAPSAAPKEPIEGEVISPDVLKELEED